MGACMRRSTDSEIGQVEHVNLNSNVSARRVPSILRVSAGLVDARIPGASPVDRIQNPLSGIPRATLLANVDAFAEEKGMNDILPLLRKGALVAQDPSSYETLPDLEEDERAALHDEIHHRWRQPRALFLTIATCSIGAAVQ